jgi:tRNA(Ile)-lysidine synthase
MAGMPWPGAIGVSGGSDSLALMHLMRQWARGEGLEPPLVLCVDHRLRPEAATECRQVVRWAAAAGLKARGLRGAVRTGSGVEAQARRLRYALLGRGARRAGLRAVYVAHTQHDQAETFLLRLARGSGVDGLAAMRPMSLFPDPAFPDLALVRPLLGFTRAELRAYLVGLGQAWIEDPMNADTQFGRVRVRNVLPVLEEAGVGIGRIADAAEHLGRAREALDTVRDAILSRACRPASEGILVDPRALTAAPRELGLRALAAVLMAVAHAEYRPRFERLEALLDAIGSGAAGAGRTLHGCKIARAPRRLAKFGTGTLLIRREEAPRNGKGKARSRVPRVS